MNIDALNQILDKLDEISEKATLKDIFIPSVAELELIPDTDPLRYKIIDSATKYKIDNGLPIRLPYISSFNPNDSVYYLEALEETTGYIYHTHGFTHTRISIRVFDGVYSFRFLS